MGVPEGDTLLGFLEKVLVLCALMVFSPVEIPPVNSMPRCLALMWLQLACFGVTTKTWHLESLKPFAFCCPMPPRHWGSAGVRWKWLHFGCCCKGLCRQQTVSPWPWCCCRGHWWRWGRELRYTGNQFPCSGTLSLSDTEKGVRGAWVTLHRLPFWGILLKVLQTFNKMVLVWSLLPSSYATCKDKFGFHRIVAFGKLCCASMMMMRRSSWWAVLSFATHLSSLQQMDDWFYPRQRCGSSFIIKSCVASNDILFHFKSFLIAPLLCPLCLITLWATWCRCSWRLVWKGEHACTLCEEIGCPFFQVLVWWKHWGTCMSPVSNTLLIAWGLSVGVNLTLKESSKSSLLAKRNLRKDHLARPPLSPLPQKEKEKKWRPRNLRAEELYMAHRGFTSIAGSTCVCCIIVIIAFLCVWCCRH